MNPEIEEKLERLRSLLTVNSLDGLIINTQHNFAWLTGGALNGIDESRENGAAYILVTVKGKTFLLANNIEMHRLLSEQLDHLDIEPVEFKWQDEKADPEIALKKAIAIAGNKIAADLPIFASAPSIEGKIALCRHLLTEEEISRFRSLGSDASTAMNRTIKGLSIGDTERAIAENLRKELSFFNISSIVTLAAADERISSYRHPVPTDKRLKNELLLVTCAKRHGLIVSLSRMVSITKPSDRLMRHTEAAAYVHAKLMSETRAGKRASELYTVAANAYSKVGFSVEIDLHHQGGAVGYRTREWVAHPKSTDTVQASQAFAWNPSITGTKVEETFILTNGSLETITADADIPTIETTINGITYRSPGVYSF